MNYARSDDPLGRRLVFLGKRLQRRFEDVLAEQGTTLPTWSVLRYVSMHPDPSQSELATMIGIEGPTLTRHLDRLCAEGLVSRTRDETDRRIIRIGLTDKGWAKWGELHTVVETLDTELVHRLTPDQLRALDDAIRTLTRALEEEHVIA